tara:strand:+ start:290 stop:460 length:171 start_codon:yes stop_codon:yes gene_type:complete
VALVDVDDGIDKARRDSPTMKPSKKLVDEARPVKRPIGQAMNTLQVPAGQRRRSRL